MLKYVLHSQKDSTYPGFGFVVTISAGMCSSSQGAIFNSSSRLLIFDTTFFRPSIVAEDRGSIVFITQLHDVCNFSEYLDTSNADISIHIINNEKRTSIKYF